MRRFPRLVVRRSVLALAVLSVGTTACVTSTSPKSEAGPGDVQAGRPAATAPASPNETPALGNMTEAPAEARPVSLVGGGQLDLAAYMDKPLLLWFWAPF